MTDDSLIVRLRPVEPEDYELLYKWVNDRPTRIQSSSFAPISWHEHVTWIERILIDKSVVLLVIEHTATGQPIGHVMLSQISTVHRSCEMSIRIGDSKHRNKGFGTAAIRECLDHAKRDLGLRRVQLTVFADNARAIRTYEKCGFIQEGHLRSAVYVDGKYKDVIIMSTLIENGK